jgi:phosphatidylglycerophosphate synthase
MSNSVSKSPIKGKETVIKRHDYIFLPFIKPLPKWITPNHLSFLRLMLALPIIVLTSSHFYKTAGIIFLVAAVLDAMDGSMARLRNQKTDIGELLDPTADKAVNFMVLIGFLFSVKTNTYLGLILAILIIDTCLFGIALFKFFVKAIFPRINPIHHDEMGIPPILYNIKVNRTGANMWGKIKMVTQVIVIEALLLFDPQTSLWIHEKYSFLPHKMTLLHFSLPLLLACIVLGLLSLYGHIRVISFNKEEVKVVKEIAEKTEET